MPKKNKKLNWDKIARCKGFSCEKDMWENLYIEKNNDPNILALKMNCGVSTIWIRLKAHGIKRGRRNISRNWGARGV